MTQTTRQLPRRGRDPLIVTHGVLLPGTRLQYHFMSAQNRASAKQALLDDGYVIIRPRDEAFESEMATLAVIIDYLEPSSTRAVVTLGGVARVKLERFHPLDDRALVDWQRVDEFVDDTTSGKALAADVLGTMSQLADAGYGLADSIGQKAAAVGDLAAIADIIGSVTFDSPEEHRRLLEEPDVIARLQLVRERLTELNRTARD